jgi:mannosylglycerate hydrolase
MTRDVAVVPHTHWDREWYEPFQTFRLKLVDLVDELLPLLEADPGFAHFMLDGQMAVVDDYLAVRPEQEERLRALAASGRVGLGPWYVLMDEFLVSGETMVRDLQLGFARATSFGGAMQVGYLPDMFGHVAQMPQLLRQFGLEHAVVWRGVPSAVDRTAFWWSAPDGSTVRAEYLLEGYGNGAVLPDDAKGLLAMIERFELDHASHLERDGEGAEPHPSPLLWMNGTDHQLPVSYLGRVLAEANALQDDYHLQVTSLADYLNRATCDALPRWQGELRSGARANLLMGVGSNRVDVKQAAAVAERTLERLAEPLSALFLPADRWPGALLDVAWLELIRNSAHDSSCACSVDEVVDAVLHRYAEARQVADGLADRALDALSSSLAEPGPVAVNPSARRRSGVVELVLPGTEPVEGTQVLHVDDGRAGADGLTRADCLTLVEAALTGLPELRDVEIEVLPPDGDGPGVLDVRLRTSPDGHGERYHGQARSVLAERAAEAPDGPARIALVTPPSQQVLAWADDVPGFGWAAVAPAPPPTAVTIDGGVEGGAVVVANGLVVVEVDPRTGTFALADPDGTVRVDGLDRLVDDGDAGDTYNYSPPDGDLVVDTPDAVTVSVLERGPLRARVRVDRSYRWPERVVAGRRGGEREVGVATTIELQAGSPLVRVTTELDNPCRDHRLRAWFPLPESATTSHAECAFAVVERGLDAEGGPHERAMSTFPSRRFVTAGGLTVVHEGLLEYELVDRGPDGEGPARALALTLLRATGLLSNGPMRFRPLPAGPIVPVEGAQVPGRHTFRYALRLGDDPAAAYAAVDDAFLPLVVRAAPGGGHRPPRGGALEVVGAEVSAVLRDAGHLVVRVFNPSDEPIEVRFPGRRGWRRDLRGRTREAFEELVTLEPWQIGTVQLADGA